MRGDKVGSRRQLFSNNSILDAVPLDDLFERSVISTSKFFPGLATLDIDKTAPLRIVGGATNKILEACLPLGNLVFGDGVQAHCEIAIWMKSVGEPIIGELAFSYRVNNQNRALDKAHQRADKFFKALQLELDSWLASGSTKTALIYGKPE